MRWGEKGRETRRKMAVSGRMRWRERERETRRKRMQRRNKMKAQKGKAGTEGKSDRWRRKDRCSRIKKDRWGETVRLGQRQTVKQEGGKTDRDGEKE